jgi:hypothetical protein
MTQMHSIAIRQPWTLLHEREDAKPRTDRQSEAERAAAARKIEARLARNRDRVFAEFTLCGRPYF